MAEMPIHTVIWRNVEALMQHHWKGLNQSRLAREAGIGKATTDRLKKNEGEIKTETIVSMAKVFKVAPWLLLYPGLDPAHPPHPKALSKLGLDVAQAIDAIPDEGGRAQAYAMCLQIATMKRQLSDVAVTSPSPAPAARAKPKPVRVR